MTRPLYKPAMGHPTGRGRHGRHTGLWFDKFCDQWRVKDGLWTMSAGDGGDSPKLTWIQDIAHDGAVGLPQQVAESTLRLVRLVEGRGGRFTVFKTESRFVTGLGRSHPVENGFAWHPTLGTPYLPGSSIKGMVRSWACTQAAPPPSRDAIARLLGTENRVGAVCFLDAIPITSVRLEADVMTPHYAGWDEKDPPGDWCSPNPIPFLVTAAQTRLLFGIIPRGRLDRKELDLTIDWLAAALAWSGAGAKTAVGYGRMAQDDAATRKLSEELAASHEAQARKRRDDERRARLTPLELDLEVIAQRRKDVQPYLAWLQLLLDGNWAGDLGTQKAVAKKIQEEMEGAGKWKTASTKKRPEKDKDYQRTLSVMRFLEH